jgi:hypothetical protein
MRVDKEQRERTFILPTGGLKGRYVRYQLEGVGYLSIAEVQVYESADQPLFNYVGGSPISPTQYPGGLTYSPEQSFDEAWRGVSAEGEWSLLVRDTESGMLGAISDWILHITDEGGQVTDYYMKMNVVIDQMPRYGNLFVPFDQLQTEHLDRDRNGKLDRKEGQKYLEHYVRGYRQMSEGERAAILDTFLMDMQLYGGVRLQEAEGLQRYLSSCYGRVTDSYSLWRYAGNNHPLPGGLVSSTCVNRFGVGKPMSSNEDGSIAFKHAILGQRRVRYVPVQGYVGGDSFTFKVQMGPKESPVAGEISIVVKLCRGYSECQNDLFIQTRFPEADRRWKWGSV